MQAVLALDVDLLHRRVRFARRRGCISRSAAASWCLGRRRISACTASGEDQAAARHSRRRAEVSAGGWRCACDRTISQGRRRSRHSTVLSVRTRRPLPPGRGGCARIAASASAGVPVVSTDRQLTVEISRRGVSRAVTSNSQLRESARDQRSICAAAAGCAHAPRSACSCT